MIRHISRSRILLVLCGVFFLVACAGSASFYHGDLHAFVVGASCSSSEKARMGAEAAFDGDTRTRWGSLFKDGEWIACQLDRTVAAETVVIQWETARAADYALLIKGATGDWVEVAKFRNKNPKELVDVIALRQATEMTALKIRCDRRATEWGNSIFEITVFGSAAGSPPKKNLVGWKPAPTAWELREREIAKRLIEIAAKDPVTSRDMTDDQFLELVSRRAFDFFWWETNPENGLTKDRGRNFMSSEELASASVANTGYALTAYCIGVERGWVSRAEALERTLLTLRTFAADSPVQNNHGFYPHFVNILTGATDGGSEISTIDTVLLLAGVLTAEQYFGDTEVSRLSRLICERVDWKWAMNGNPNFVSHGVDARGNFIGNVWGSSTEALLIYLVAMGSPTHGLTVKSWNAIDRHRGDYEGYEWVVEYGAQNMFPYHYPDLWYDFRGKVDGNGEDYWLNATTAALAMREYCIREAVKFPRSYGPNGWGLSPSDGLDNKYMIYGFPPGMAAPPDGTIVMPALAGSIQWLPRHVIQALRHIYDTYRSKVWGKYGFTDALNPQRDFFTSDVIGIDQGTLLIGIENHRTGMVWKFFMAHPWIQRSTQAIGWKTRPHFGDPDGPIDLVRVGTWKLKSGDGAYEAATLDDKDWTPVLVPDRWENNGGAWARYDGVAWYRAGFEIDEARLELWKKSRKPIVLTIGAIDDTDITYVNGVKVGETPAGEGVWKAPRRYTVPLANLKAGVNTIAVRVNDETGGGGIWAPPVELGIQ